MMICPGPQTSYHDINYDGHMDTMDTCKSFQKDRMNSVGSQSEDVAALPVLSTHGGQ